MGSSRRILLEFKRKIPGQASCKAQQLPRGGERERTEKARAVELSQHGGQTHGQASARSGRTLKPECQPVSMCRKEERTNIVLSGVGERSVQMQTLQGQLRERLPSLRFCVRYFSNSVTLIQ